MCFLDSKTNVKMCAVYLFEASQAKGNRPTYNMKTTFNINRLYWRFTWRLDCALALLDGSDIYLAIVCITLLP